VVDDAGLGEIERRTRCDQLSGTRSTSLLQARDDRYTFHRFLLSAAATVGGPQFVDVGRGFIVSPRTRT
jgi:hypothetical protein